MGWNRVRWEWLTPGERREQLEEVVAVYPRLRRPLRDLGTGSLLAGGVVGWRVVVAWDPGVVSWVWLIPFEGIGAVIGAGVMFWLAEWVFATAGLQLVIPRSGNRRRILYWGCCWLLAVSVLGLFIGMVLAGGGSFGLGGRGVLSPLAFGCVLGLSVWAVRVLRGDGVREAVGVGGWAAALLVLAWGWSDGDGVPWPGLRQRVLASPWPALALLTPVLVWGSVRCWRGMAGSRRRLVRIGADLVFSVLLGLVLVFAVVGLANILGLAPGEVVALRNVLRWVGGVSNVPPWVWFVVYLGLAVWALWFAAVPQGPRATARWERRLRPVRRLDRVRRVLTGVHIALLTVVLIGLTGPPVLSGVLRRQVEAEATVAFQREVRARAQVVAYEQIARRMSDLGDDEQSSVVPLRLLVLRIHADLHPGDSDRPATGPELRVARQLGQAQAEVVGAVLNPTGPADFSAFETGSPRASPIEDRLRELQQARASADVQARRVGAAAEYAQAAVVNALQAVSPLDIGPGELRDVVTEYLGGVVESSPRLNRVFRSWALRLGTVDAFAVRWLVVPVPSALAGRVALRTGARPSVEHGAGTGDDAALIETAVDTAAQHESGVRCAGCHPVDGGTRPAPRERFRPRWFP